jgi:hypothetical protein
MNNYNAGAGDSTPGRVPNNSPEPGNNYRLVGDIRIFPKTMAEPKPMAKPGQKRLYPAAAGAADTIKTSRETNIIFISFPSKGCDFILICLD